MQVNAVGSSAFSRWDTYISPAERWPRDPLIEAVSDAMAEILKSKHPKANSDFEPAVIDNVTRHNPESQIASQNLDKESASILANKIHFISSEMHAVQPERIKQLLN